MNDRTIDMRHMSRECPECGQRFSPDGVFCPFDGTRLESPSTSVASSDPLLGTTIDGRYEVIELLGEGGMGRVYQVRHTGLGRLFALKALRRELARDEELSQRFMREAKAMASVRHPHIVEITDFGRLPDGVPYFVMEMLVGETLAQVIKAHGCVPIERGVAILEQVAAALAAAHDAGVVHRDLKPENVFLVGSVAGAAGQEGRRTGGADCDDVRVVDFGAAKIIGSSQVTRSGVVFGTPYYMSPEQASGSQVDTRTDIYSFGVILYEMFTGRVPFEGDTYMNVLTQHMFVEPEPPSRKSPLGSALGALDQVTMVCLAKKPEKRFGSMREVCAALAAARAGQTEVLPAYASFPGTGKRGGFDAPEPTPPTLEEIRRAIEDGARLTARHPWVGIALAAVGMGAALGAGFWVYLHRQAPPEPARAREGMAAAARTAESTASPEVTMSAGVPPAVAPSVLAASSLPSAPPSSSVVPPVPMASGLPPARPHPRRVAPSYPPPIDDVSDPFRAK